MKRDYVLQLAAEIWKVNLAVWDHDQITAYFQTEREEIQKKLHSAKIRKMISDMKEQSDHQSFPVIRKDAYSLYWFCLKEEKAGTYITGGPTSLEKMNAVDLYQISHFYEVPFHENEIANIRIEQFLAMMKMLTGCLNDRETDEKELLAGNHLTSDEKEEYQIHEIREEMEERYHHTYRQERAVLECVRLGNTKKALSLTDALLDATGRMGKNASTHWYNLAVTCITLITRSAIEGGISSEKAYRMSDSYIQKLQINESIPEIHQLIKEAIVNFTDCVRQRQEKNHTGYVSACLEFIAKHYPEKVYIQDVADALGISEGYLSRLFCKEEGITFQHYLLEYRLKRACEMLRYSDDSILHISMACGFPNQSYFARKLRSLTGLSPTEYRHRYQTAEPLEKK